MEFGQRDLRLADYVAVDGPDGVVVLVPIEHFESSRPPSPQRRLAPPLDRSARPRRSVDEKDAGLREYFARVRPLLGAVGKASWCESQTPYTSLMADCQDLATEPSIAEAVGKYLQQRPAVREAANMLVTAISMSANANWRETPDVVRATAARGWFLNRWLPTFLIVDGPIMRFMAMVASNGQKGRGETFIAARKVLLDSTFKEVRNAFAHWSFGWQTIEGDHWIVVFDVETEAETMRFHQRQGDALHMIAWTIVDILNQTFFQTRYVTLSRDRSQSSAPR